MRAAPCREATGATRFRRNPGCCFASPRRAEPRSALRPALRSPPIQQRTQLSTVAHSCRSSLSSFVNRILGAYAMDFIPKKLNKEAKLAARCGPVDPPTDQHRVVFDLKIAKALGLTIRFFFSLPPIDDGIRLHDFRGKFIYRAHRRRWQSSRDSDDCAEAEFYIGEWHLHARRRTEAIAALQVAAKSCPRWFMEHTAAVMKLKRQRAVGAAENVEESPSSAR